MSAPERTTTEQLREGFFHHRGRICPGIEVLTAKAQDDAAHPTTGVLGALLEGVVAAYG